VNPAEQSVGGADQDPVFLLSLRKDRRAQQEHGENGVAGGGAFAEIDALPADGPGTGLRLRLPGILDGIFGDASSSGGEEEGGAEVLGLDLVFLGLSLIHI